MVLVVHGNLEAGTVLWHGQVFPLIVSLVASFDYLLATPLPVSTQSRASLNSLQVYRGEGGPGVNGISGMVDSLYQTKQKYILKIRTFT